MIASLYLKVKAGEEDSGESEEVSLMPYSKYSPKQKRLAAVAEPRKKITQADIIAVRRKRKRKK